MWNRTLFNKTKRIGTGTYEWLITEKLDGSNLCLFKLDDALYIAQRKKIMKLDEALDSGKNELYKDLLQWLEKHGEELNREILEKYAVCGEWLGMGQLHYPSSWEPFRMFAYAKLKGESVETVELTDSVYNPDLFCNAFLDVQPDYIESVPVVTLWADAPTVQTLDSLYEHYTCYVQRPVEGFVITQTNMPEGRWKYVRMKNGKLDSHITAEEMEMRKLEGLTRKAAHADARRRKLQYDKS